MATTFNIGDKVKLIHDGKFTFAVVYENGNKFGGFRVEGVEGKIKGVVPGALLPVTDKEFEAGLDENMTSLIEANGATDPEYVAMIKERRIKLTSEAIIEREKAETEAEVQAAAKSMSEESGANEEEEEENDD
jgi:hypothetical protein